MSVKTSEESPKKKSSSGISSARPPLSPETELTLEIPSVLSSSKLPKTTHGLTDQIVKRAREYLWPSLETPPGIVTPSVLHYIRKEGDKFEDAVETLMNAKEIGLSIQFEAQLLPRDGALSLLCLSTSSDVYIFDILEMGSKIFKWGLGMIFKNPEIVKVVHDGRLMRQPSVIFIVYYMKPA